MLPCPILVTANTDAGSTAKLLSLNPNQAILPSAKLSAGVVRTIGKKRVSMTMTDDPKTAKRHIATFESPEMEVVYTAKVQESQFGRQAGPAGAAGPTTTTTSSTTFADDAAPQVASNNNNNNGNGNNGNNNASAPRFWCNAVLRCADDHSLSSFQLLDNEIAKCFPPAMLVGFRSGINSVESILTAPKDDPSCANIIRMDVPFDNTTHNLLVFAVDESNQPMNVIQQIPANSRVKVVFTAEMQQSETPVRRVSIKLMMQQLCIIESGQQFSMMRSCSAFQTVGPPHPTPAANVATAAATAAAAAPVPSHADPTTLTQPPPPDTPSSPITTSTTASPPLSLSDAAAAESTTQPPPAKKAKQT